MSLLVRRPGAAAGTAASVVADLVRFEMSSGCRSKKLSSEVFSTLQLLRENPARKCGSSRKQEFAGHSRRPSLRMACRRSMTTMTTPPHVGNEIEDVLIVGAGPVGVYLSILLARMGVRSVVIDRSGTCFDSSDDERRMHPRAHVLHTRSMELLREIGIFEDVEKEMPALEQWKHFRYCTSLLGTELAAVDHCDDSDGAASNLRTNSPAFVAHLSQPRLESLLWRAARCPTAAAHIKFAPHHELQDLRIHADHVEANLLVSQRSTQATDARHPISSLSGASRGGSIVGKFKYVVGADGAQSAVRKMSLRIPNPESRIPTSPNPESRIPNPECRIPTCRMPNP